jgi:hypothetical protein
LSDAAGNFREQLAFDAWGKRRTPDGSATPDTLDGVTDNKGFTGNEMLDRLDLVHMNGRVYDPVKVAGAAAAPAGAIGAPGGPVVSDAEIDRTVSRGLRWAADKVDDFNRSEPGRMLQGATVGETGVAVGGLKAGLLWLGRLGSVAKQAATGAEDLADLAKFRAGLGLKVGEGTLARLEVNGQAFYGINAHGQPTTMSVMARQLGIQQLTVVTPQGVTVIRP